MKIIKSFEINLKDMPASGQTREFSVIGDANSIFSLEVKNEDGYYYNFDTKLFAATKARLNRKRIVGARFTGAINFPAAGDDDQYDIYLFAENGYDTFHAPVNEVRFPDGGLDLNSSTGSNSSLLQKVIYQYDDTTLTLTALSPNGATVFGSMSVASATIALSRNQQLTSFSFSVVVTAHTSKAFQIARQPNSTDITGKVERAIVAPVSIPNENIYPTVTSTDTVDGIIAGGGSVVKVVMDNNVADKMVVGDKITAATSTSTVDGEVESSVNVTMDHGVTTKMSIGDQVTVGTGEASVAFVAATGESINNTLVKVTALRVGGDANVFALSEAVVVPDGTALIFSARCNRDLTTVEALNPDTDNVKEFSMSQNTGLVDGVALSFSSQENHKWSVGGIGILGLKNGARLIGANITAGSKISPLSDTITYETITEDEHGGLQKTTNTVTTVTSPALETAQQPATTTNGKITAQLGNITFNKQQKLALSGDTVGMYAYGQNAIKELLGVDIKLENLKVELTKPTTTTTEATSAHATIAVADREGVINGVSQVSGIGINPLLIDPTLTTGGGLDGAGDWVMDAVQTLENGTTLTVENTSRVATITGTISINEVGLDDFTLFFDIERILSA